MLYTKVIDNTVWIISATSQEDADDQFEKNKTRRVTRMIYLINDVISDIFNYKKTTTVEIVTSEDDVLEFLKRPENLKKFKGEIKIEKVIL